MKKIIKSKASKKFDGVVVAIAKEHESIDGYYSVWSNTECVDFGLSLKSAKEIYASF
jgi:hypothetical protein